MPQRREKKKKNSFWQDLAGTLGNGLWKVVEWIVLLIPTMIKQAASFVLWLAGTILNFTIYIGILKMGSIIDSSEGIRLGWSIFRDVINLFFIFGLLYLSITTIVHGWTENGKKQLSLTIAAALLINFSFFFTTLLIDTSNIVTLSFYDKMGEDCAFPTTSKGDGSSLPNLYSNIALKEVNIRNFTDGGLSYCFMQKLQITTAYTPESLAETNALDEAKKTGDLSITQKMINLLMAALIFLVAALVFAAIAFVIMGRFFILIILLITSPVMFAGWILPKLKEHTDEWVKKLTGQLVSLPAMFLMLYISYILSGTITDGFVGQSLDKSNGTLFNLFTSDGAGTLGIMINLMIVLGLLISSLLLGSKLGAAVGSIGVGLSGTAALGRGVLGGMVGGSMRKLGAKYSDSKWVGGAAKWVSRRGADLGRMSFDARNVPGVASNMKKAGIDLGKGGKGYTPRREAREKRQAKADKIAQESYEKAGGVTKFDEDAIKEEAAKKTAARPEYMAEQANLDRVNAEIEASQNEIKSKKDEIAEIDRRLEDKTLARREKDKLNNKKSELESEIKSAEVTINDNSENKVTIEGNLNKIRKSSEKEDTVKAIKELGGRYSKWGNPIGHRAQRFAESQYKEMKKTKDKKFRESIMKEMKEELDKEEKEDK